MSRYALSDALVAASLVAIIILLAPVRIAQRLAVSHKIVGKV